MISARPLEAGGGRVTAVLDFGDVAHEVWWEVAAPDAAPEAPPVGDMLVPTTLLAAMLGGNDVRVDAPVTVAMAAGAERAGDVFATWSRRRLLEGAGDPGYRRVRLEAAATTTRPPVGGDGAGVAAMFSAGVDSFHTVLRHRHRLDALVYVVGFDVRLGDPALPGVLRLVRSAAASLGLPLVEVRTNLRDVLDAYVPWDDQHGAALATVALLLDDRFAEVLVPSTHTYDDLYPLGSHPVLDPLWSNGAVVLVNDGAEADRATKLAGIATLEAARRTLRVCFQFVEGVTNCGRCEKCVRTMVGARIAGVPGAFDTLPALRGPRMLVRVARCEPRNRASTWQWYQRMLAGEVSDRPLALVVGVAMWRWRARRWWERLRRRSARHRHL